MITKVLSQSHSGTLRRVLQLTKPGRIPPPAVNGQIDIEVAVPENTLLIRTGSSAAPGMADKSSEASTWNLGIISFRPVSPIGQAALIWSTASELGDKPLPPLISMLFPNDRVLVFAPHPDDETLAIGALLIRAFADRLPVRVVYVTNGDNNPWAQRLGERRWTIGEHDRRRWGERRRGEALAALASLGGNSSCASFLHLPDQGITQLLMRGDSKIMDLLRGEISGWKPSLIVQPAAEDAHPDHNSLHVLLTAIHLANPENRPRILNYLVHPSKTAQPPNPFSTELTPPEVQRKLKAILCHETQVVASRKRFTSYATGEEVYYEESPAPSDHLPFSSTSISGNTLNLQLDDHDLGRSKVHLLVALQTAAGEPLRWSLTLGRNMERGELRNELAASSPEPVEIHWNRAAPRIRFVKIPRLTCAFIKVCAPTLFFDRFGWTRVSFVQRAGKGRPERRYSRLEA